MGKLKAGPLLRTLAKEVVTLPAASTVRPTRVPGCRVREGLLPALPSGLVSARSVWGVDIDEAALKASVACCPCAMVCIADAHSLPFADSHFDAVSAFQVVEHLLDPDKFLDEALRVLKPGGLLVISTSNPAGIAARWLGSRWKAICREHISLRPPDVWIEALRQRFDVLEYGTTGLTGFPLMRRLPFGLLNWVPMAVLGFFPWLGGESLVVVCRKPVANMESSLR